MFGYILPEKGELKVREYECYRAIYCGVCQSIGRRYGLIPRFTLNYDSVFLALIMMSVLDLTNEMKPKRCMVHPLNKRPMSQGNDGIDYAADMSLLLFYYKLKDDWEDEKSPVALAGVVTLKGMAKKLTRKHPDKASEIEQRLDELLQVEKNKISDIDAAAEPFAKLMEATLTFESLCQDKKTLKALGWLGYNIGKWIYMIDAYDDIEKDKKSGSYNPFLCEYELAHPGSADCAQTIKEEIQSRVEFLLLCCLSEVSKAFELLNLKNDKQIIDNIVYLGLLKKTEQILKQGRCKNVE